MRFGEIPLHCKKLAERIWESGFRTVTRLRHNNFVKTLRGDRVTAFEIILGGRAEPVRPISPIQEKSKRVRMEQYPIRHAD